jgi:hypothetical protein
MKTYKREVVVQRLDERRYALAVDGVVRYVGTEEECRRRLAMWSRRRSAPTRTKPWDGYGAFCADFGAHQCGYISGSYAAPTEP